MINLKDIGSAWEKKKEQQIGHNVCQFTLMVNKPTVLFTYYRSYVNLQKMKIIYNHLEYTNEQNIVYML